MSNNTTDTIVCNTPSWLPLLFNRIVYTNYYVLPLISLVICIIPGLFTAVAFCRLYSKEVAYIYQRVYVCQIVVLGLGQAFYLITRRFAGWGVVGYQHWFTSNYFLMWLTARFSSLVANGGNLSSLTVLTSMAFDRFLAIGFPHRYQAINRKQMGIILAILSYTFGFGASLFDLPRLQLQTIGDEYKLITDTNYTSLLAVKFFSNLRNALDILFATLLACLNITTVTFFIRQSRKQKLLTGRNLRHDDREREKRKLERNLLVLTVSQSCVVLIEQPLLVANSLALYAGQYALACYYPYIGPLLDCFAEINHSLTLLELYIISKPFRDMLHKIPRLKCLPNKHSPSRDSVSNANTDRTNVNSSTETSNTSFCQRLRHRVITMLKKHSSNNVVVRDDAAQLAANRMITVNS